jgi:outer membrane biosynthesis protein TonB
MSRHRVATSSSTLFAGLISCASALAQPGSAAAPTAVDEAHIKEYWTRIHDASKPPPLFPRAAIQVATSGCVTVGYAIGADGVTADAKVLKSYLAKKDGDEIRAQFEKNVLGNVAVWRYEPAAGKTAQAVSTYSTVTAVAEMGLHRQSFQDEVAAHCKIENFGAEPHS